MWRVHSLSLWLGALYLAFDFALFPLGARFRVRHDNEVPAMHFFIVEMPFFFTMLTVGRGDPDVID